MPVHCGHCLKRVGARERSGAAERAAGAQQPAPSLVAHPCCRCAARWRSAASCSCRCRASVPRRGWRRRWRQRTAAAPICCSTRARRQTPGRCACFLMQGFGLRDAPQARAALRVSGPLAVAQVRLCFLFSGEHLVRQGAPVLFRAGPRGGGAGPAVRAEHSGAGARVQPVAGPAVPAAAPAGRPPAGALQQRPGPAERGGGRPGGARPVAVHAAGAGGGRGGGGGRRGRAAGGGHVLERRVPVGAGPRLPAVAAAV